MQLTPYTPPKPKPEWQVFLESLPKKLTLTDLKERYMYLGSAKEKANLLRDILARHEQDLPEAKAYYELYIQKFVHVFSLRDGEMQGKSFVFDFGKTEFREDGVQFYSFDKDVTLNLEYEEPDGNTVIFENIVPIKSNAFYSNEEITPEAVRYLKIAKCFHNYIDRTALLRIHVEHEAEFFERIAQQPTTDTPPEQTKPERRTVKRVSSKRPKILQGSLAVALESLRKSGGENPIKGKTQDQVAVLGYMLFNNEKTGKKFINADGIRTSLNSAIKCDENQFELVENHILTNALTIRELLDSEKVRNMVRLMAKNRNKSAKQPTIKGSYKKKV